MIGLSFVKKQQGMQIDLTFEIRNFCDLGMMQFSLDYFHSTILASVCCASRFINVNR